MNLLSLLTKGFNAMAKKIEMPMIIKPVNALYRNKITSPIPSKMSQKRIMDFVSISTTFFDICLLVVNLLYHKMLEAFA